MLLNNAILIFFRKETLHVYQKSYKIKTSQTYFTLISCILRFRFNYTYHHQDLWQRRCCADFACDSVVCFVPLVSKQIIMFALIRVRKPDIGRYLMYLYTLNVCSGGSGSQWHALKCTRIMGGLILSTPWNTKVTFAQRIIVSFQLVCGFGCSKQTTKQSFRLPSNSYM